jgi:GT2 family glycosyltransferase
MVRLVILNFNGGEYVLRAVEHALALDWPADRLEVVVVDNASADGSDVAIESAFSAPRGDRAPGPRVRVIRSATNTGFPGNNLGMVDREGVDLVGLINNDAFVEPGWLRALADALDDDDRVGAACPKFILADRFVDLEIASDTFRVGGDPRDLGVRLSGARVGGVDRLSDVALGDGFYGWEPGPPTEPRFSWTEGRAALGVPVPVDGAIPSQVALRLATHGEPRTATLQWARGSVEVKIGTEPEWFDAGLDGDPYDVVQNAGSILVEGGWGADRGFLQRDRGQYEDPVDVFAWCGGGVLFRSQYLDEVGLFDERFFLYYEDTDMAWRGRARGWRYVYVPTAVQRHMHAASSGGEASPLFQHYVERNRLVMLTKNAPARLVRGAIVGFVTATASYARRDVVAPMLRGRRPRTQQVRRRVRSFLAFLRLLPALLGDRRELRRAQVVPDAAIVGWAVRQEDR